MDIRVVKKIKKVFEDDLLQYPNVVGVGVGFKEVSGEQTDIPSIVVYVTKKYPEEQLKPEEVLPKEIPPVLVDVKEMPVMEALPFIPRGKKEKTKKWRPVIGGISVGHPKITAGTLGGFFKIKDEFYGSELKGEIVGLTNWHVAGEHYCKKNDPMLQPAVYDGGSSNDVIGRILDFQGVVTTGSADCSIVKGTLRFLNWIAKKIRSKYRFEVVRPVKENEMDSAIFTLEVEVEPKILDIGKIEGVVDGQLRDVVEKSGRTTCHTVDAVLEDLDWTGYVRYSTGLALMKGQYAYRKKGFSAGGDSGSLIFLKDTNKVQSLLFAGGEGWTIGTPIKRVLDRFHLEVIGEA